MLFHVTANSDWSNLPLSGLFVDMLRRIATLGRPGGVAAGGVETTAAGDRATPTAPPRCWRPSRRSTATACCARRRRPPRRSRPPRIDTVKPGVDHPPGYYGPQARPRALNVLGAKSELKPLAAPSLAAERRAYEGETTQPLKPSLLALALALLFIDIVAVLLLQAGAVLAALAPPGAATTALVVAAGSLHRHRSACRRCAVRRDPRATAHRADPRARSPAARATSRRRSRRPARSSSPTC